MRLAIKGHPTRGKEVIEILEMLGGKNNFSYDGAYKDLIYTIGSALELDILNVNSPNIKDDYIVFTLEEFLEKYPYKIWDKALFTYDNTTYFIRKMFWDDEILYELSDEIYSDGSSIPDTVIFNVPVEKLQSCKEQEIMEELVRAEDITLEKSVMCTFSEVVEGKQRLRIAMNEGFELKEENGNFFVCRKKNEYPRTYGECCAIVGNNFDENDVVGYQWPLLVQFQMLLICRDAYWKIAGDWKEKRKEKVMHYVICSTLLGEVVKDTMPNCIASYLLDFPTEEMREAFYENFKDLIEYCKELL